MISLHRNILIYIILSYFSVSADGLSTKKGIAVVPNVYQCGNLDLFTNVNWWYDYTRYPTLDNGICTETKPGHVPMIWGEWFEDADVQALEGNVVLGFNEPNYGDQANMSPEDAAARWKVLEAAATTERKLVSPSAAPCKGSDCNMKNAKKWFKQFFRACKDCRVDYLATHAYYCNATQTMDYLKDLWSIFGKPIWLTAFACGGNNMWSDIQLQYMQEILPLLEEAGYIYRYAWYATHHVGRGYVTASSNLVQHNQLTKLGQYYNDF